MIPQKHPVGRSGKIPNFPRKNSFIQQKVIRKILIKCLLTPLLLVYGFSGTAGANLTFTWNGNLNGWKARDNSHIMVTGQTMQFDIGRANQGIFRAIPGLDTKIYDIEIEVRGNGIIQPRITDVGEAGLKWIHLSPDWQIFRRRVRILKPKIGFFVVSPWKNNPPSGKCEIKRISFTQVTGVPVIDAVVKGIVMEAENHPADSQNIRVEKQAKASGGKIVYGRRWQHFVQLPLPATSKPVYIYARAKSVGGENTQLHISSVGRTLGKIPLTLEWQWVRSKALRCQQTDGKIDIICGGTKSKGMAADYLVISTNPNLSEPAVATLKPARNGLVSVGKCSAAPLIDGKLDDASWRNAVELGGFVRRMDGRPAQEQSTVKMLYDKDNLYLAFRGNESCLEIRSCKMDRFRHQVKNADDENIYGDDAMLLIIHPAGKSEAYEFVVNGNGALFDSEMNWPQLWSTRRKEWNSQATVKTRIDDGYWMVEAAIPWKAMKIIPAPGLNCGFIVGRWEKNLGEESAWQSTLKGLHNPDRLGTLRLAATVPAAWNWKKPLFQSGTNRLNMEFSALANRNFRLVQVMKYPNQPPVYYSSDLQTGPNSSPFELNRSDTFTYHYELLDMSTLDKIAVSPEYTVEPIFSSLKYSGKGELTLNNQKANTGLLPLVSGCNQLAVRISAGDNPEFVCDGQHFRIDDSWLYSSVPADGWTGKTFDDSGWKTAASAKTPAPGYYRKKIIYASTRIWPNWSLDAIYLSPGFTQILMLWGGGVKGVKTPDGFRIVVELPSHFKVLGATGVGGKYPGLTIENLKSNGEAKRIAVRIPGVKQRTEDFRNGLKWISLFIQPGLQATGKDKIHYYAEVKGRGIQEIAQVLPVKYLPPINGKRPQKMIFLMWNFQSLNNPEMKKVMFDSYCRIGITDGQYAYAAICPPGLRGFALMDPRHFAPYVREYPNTARVQIDGKTSTTNFCPLELHKARGRKFLIDYVNALLDRTGVTHLNWDFEESVWSKNSTCACFCEKCRRTFAAKYHLPEKLPSAKTIQAKYEKQWVKFVDGHFADYCGIIHDTLAARKQPTVFSVFCYFPSELAASRFGVDWSMLKGKVDIALVGYGRPQAELATIRQLFLNKGTVLNGMLAKVFQKDDFSNPVQFTAADVMQYLLDGTGGVHFFAYLFFDARTFAAIAEVSRLVAENEAFFLQHTPAPGSWEINGIAPEYVRYWQSGKEVLLILFNPTLKSFNYRIINSDLKETFTGVVPPGKVKVFRRKL